MNVEEIFKNAKKYGFDFLGELITTLDKESDRGTILICASTIDCILEDLIKKYLNKNKNRENEIEKLFEYPNPLNTFASKIQMSYCLGLIEKDCYEDFERIRKIRNVLAHGYEYKDFASEEIASIVFKLVGAKKCWENSRKKNPEKYAEPNNTSEKIDVRKIARVVFITTVTCWLGDIAHKVERVPVFLLKDSTIDDLSNFLKKKDLSAINLELLSKLV